MKASDVVICAKTVILASGGASYPRSGSSGHGYRLAAALGRRITPLRPALVPLLTELLPSCLGDCHLAVIKTTAKLDAAEWRRIHH